ncbi:MAG: diguanylate cyclase [Armatimonadetes bacterium]|nr:diguanylate cyclase [Armatimonadota bacterium]
MACQVLAVDDDLGIRQYLSAHLDLEGFRVVSAEDGPSALRMAEQVRPDVILLDVMLPRMDGFETCRCLKSSPTTREIPVIFLSVRASTKDKIQGLEAGADDYVVKPFDPQELIWRIKAVHRRSSTSLSQVREIEKRAVQLAKMNQALRQQAITDGLTGLFNRRHFSERLEQEWARATRYKRPFSLLLLDLDDFKQVNDRFGHPVGDAVLSEVGSAIVSAVRKVDFPARYGGEEFAVILPETPEEGALVAAHRIREKVEALQVATSDEIVSITASLGISCYPDGAVGAQG